MRSSLAATAVACAGAFALGWAVKPDDNSQPRYGDALELPSNCRAYVDASVAGFRAKRYNADEVMAGLERNCGAAGQLWKK